ncbi:MULTISPECIES: hypothetical protein [unclassified Akkermansia]|uniref:hypothetical protein n=1 Tax=unclassified Akkermansia TaxID=2608915 RepID=UPI000E7DAB69|nr:MULTISPECIES: hypothetical protein [unclassified Akkermansia]HBN17698.1 hypothetical protein [Akkermansia sp.]
MDKRPTSQYLCAGWSFCLGEAESRLVTTSMPHSQPMDTEAQLTSIDFNLREVGKDEAVSKTLSANRTTPLLQGFILSKNIIFKELLQNPFHLYAAPPAFEAIRQ